jgi:hypothetical protein
MTEPEDKETNPQNKIHPNDPPDPDPGPPDPLSEPVEWDDEDRMLMAESLLDMLPKTKGCVA